MGVGEDNQHLWTDGRSQRSLLYVILYFIIEFGPFRLGNISAIYLKVKFLSNICFLSVCGFFTRKSKMKSNMAAKTSIF